MKLYKWNPALPLFLNNALSKGLKLTYGERRLLWLAKHLATLKKGYDQCRFTHASCGTPACAWGWYRRITPNRSWDHTVDTPLFTGMHLWSSQSVEFGINYDEAEELFGPTGCNNAETGKQAARYIRRFVVRHAKVRAREQRA